MQAFTLQAPAQHAPNPISAPSADRLEYKTNDMQRLGTRCWKELINKGVPFQDARELAIAISHFIYLSTLPSEHQKSLIDRYYQHLVATDILSLQLS